MMGHNDPKHPHRKKVSWDEPNVRRDSTTTPAPKRPDKKSSIAGRVFRANLSLRVSILWQVAVVVVLTISIVYSMAYVILRYGFFGDSNDTSVRSYVQEWYRGLGADTLLLGGTAAVSIQNGTCIGRAWIQQMGDVIPATSPDHVALILQNMGISGIPSVDAALKELKREPQPLDSFYSTSQTCLEANFAVEELACLVEKESPWTLSNPEQKNVLEYHVNLAAVLDRLTLYLLDNVVALHDVSEVKATSRRDLLEDAVVVMYEDRERQDLVMDRYDSTTRALQAVGRAIAENEDVPLKPGMQASILGAVKVDAALGHDPNARVGLALATRIPFDSFTQDKMFKWTLGKDWADAYTAWGLTNVMGTAPLTLLPELLVPAVSCAGVNSSLAEDFVARRVVSGALSAMHMFQRPSPNSGLGSEAVQHIADFMTSQTSTDLPLERFAVASVMGESNLRTVSLANPTDDTVERLLSPLSREASSNDFELGVTDTAPTADLSDQQFGVYVGFILFVTMVLAGLGLELLVWLMFLQGPWSKETEDRWKLAQFAFPLLGATTVGLSNTYNYLALPFLVLTMWKFGFPETILYLYAALNEKKHSKMERFVDFLSGEGTVVHHSISAFYVAMLVTHVLPSSRHTVEVALPLLIQHWFVLLKYTNHLAYCVIQLIAEAWFEWVGFSNMESLWEAHWTGGVVILSMLFAHWVYLVAATIGLFITTEHSDTDQVEHLNEIGEESREFNLNNPDPPGMRHSSAPPERFTCRKLSPHLGTFRRITLSQEASEEVLKHQESPRSSTTFGQSTEDDDEPEETRREQPSVAVAAPPAHRPSVGGGLAQVSLPVH